MATSHCSECNRPLPQFWTLDEQRLDALEDFAESKQLNIDTLVRPGAPLRVKIYDTWRYMLITDHPQLLTIRYLSMRDEPMVRPETHAVKTSNNWESTLHYLKRDIARYFHIHHTVTL